MKCLLLLFASVALALFANAEDYQCGNKDGCKGRHTEDGELIEETFRLGDMVSTDAGYSVSTDDGWVKVKTNGGGGKRTGGSGRIPKVGLVIGEVMFWVDHVAIPTGVYTTLIPKTGALFLRPAVSLASLPPSPALVGLF